MLNTPARPFCRRSYSERPTRSQLPSQAAGPRLVPRCPHGSAGELPASPLSCFSFDSSSRRKQEVWRKCGRQHRTDSGMPPPLRPHREVEYESACFRRQATARCTTAGRFTTRVLAISCPRALLASAVPGSTSPQRDRGRGRSNLPDRSDRAAAHISRGAGRSAGRWIVAIARPCPRLLVIVECCPARDILDTE